MVVVEESFRSGWRNKKRQKYNTVCFAPLMWISYLSCSLIGQLLSLWLITDLWVLFSGQSPFTYDKGQHS